MSYLLDTGILIRLVDRKDPLHDIVIRSVKNLLANGQSLFISTQNAAEFYNVATRPIVANGLGLPPSIAAAILTSVIEPICAILVEQLTLYGELKRIVVQYGVSGKQIHDARLVAMMLTWNIDKILTLNERDFRRYHSEGISAVRPETLLLP